MERQIQRWRGAVVAVAGASKTGCSNDVDLGALEGVGRGVTAAERVPLTGKTVAVRPIYFWA